MKCLVLIGLLAILFSACKSRDEAPPPLPPPGASQAAPPAARAHPDPSRPDVDLTFTTPKQWTAQRPSTSMRKAQFLLPGETREADAILGVFHFPHTGGSVTANLERWYTQFKQPDGVPSASRAQTRKLKAGGFDVTVAYLRGTYLKPKSPMEMGGETAEVLHEAMLAAVVETPAGPWFFKAVGTQETIDLHRATFEDFMRSVRVGR
jgi:hypothetical protein